MIKLIACDMDGTLLDSHHKMMEANVLAILAAQRSGINFVIATGRDYGNVLPLLTQFGLNCDCILMNGSQYITAQGNVEYKVEIPYESVETIIDIFRQHDVYFQIFTDKDIYTEVSIQLLQDDFRSRLKMNRSLSDEELDELLIKDPFLTRIKKLPPISTLKKQGEAVLKIEGYRFQHPGVNKARARLKGMKHLAVASSFQDNIEVTHVNATKGEMLEKVVARCKVMHNEVMVIGDSDNDISMAMRFPNSIAMANSVEAYKRICTHITDSNDEAGVAKIIFRTIEQNRQMREFKTIKI